MGDYFPIFLLLVIGVSVGTGIVTISYLLGPRKSSSEKCDTYECGITPVSDARGRFSIKFYLIAILFVVFDVEIIYLIPWSVVFKKFLKNGLGFFLIAELAIFMCILLAGFIYVWRAGNLDWEGSFLDSEDNKDA